MILGITGRLTNMSNREIFYINKNFQDIFDKLNVILLPINGLVGIDKIVNICDGLIITGGEDINPSIYGESIEHNIILDGYADMLDFNLLKIFSKNNKPILGICRGMQVINVYFGGSLYQDMKGHKLTCDERHLINIENDTFLYECYKKEKMLVNSNHHQSIKEVANNFKVSATSEDGVIEAIEKDNIIGIEWHPEKLDMKIFEKFIEFLDKK